MSQEEAAMGGSWKGPDGTADIVTTVLSKQLYRSSRWEAGLCLGWGSGRMCVLSLTHLHQQHLRKQLWLPGEAAPTRAGSATEPALSREDFLTAGIPQAPNHKNGGEPT